MSGPVVGGLLVAVDLAGWSWRLVFLVNIPVGIAALLIPLTQGPEARWPWWMLVLLVAAPWLLGGFVAWERRLGCGARTPLLPLRLFNVGPFTGGIVLVLYIGGGLILVLTYYLQEGLDLSAERSGVLLGPIGVGHAAASAAAPRMGARWGLLVPAGGIMLTMAGLTVVALAGAFAPPAARPLWFLPALLVVGMGRGLATNPSVSAIVSSVPRHDAGAASGTMLTTTQVAEALGVAIVGSVFFAC